MKITYLTLEEAELALSRECTPHLYMVIMQDDITSEYYTTEESLNYTTDIDMVFFKLKPLVDLPSYEYYKFKLHE